MRKASEQQAEMPSDGDENGWDQPEEQGSDGWVEVGGGYASMVGNQGVGKVKEAVSTWITSRSERAEPRALKCIRNDCEPQ